MSKRSIAAIGQESSTSIPKCSWPMKKRIVKNDESSCDMSSMNNNNTCSTYACAASNQYFRQSFKKGLISRQAEQIIINLIPDYIPQKVEDIKNDLSSFGKEEDQNILELDSFVSEASHDEKFIVENALSGRTSVFCSILRVLEAAISEGHNPVQERVFYDPKKIALSIRAGDVPAEMSAKDFISFCLEILSSHSLEGNGFKDIAESDFADDIIKKLFPSSKNPLLGLSFDQSKNRQYTKKYEGSISNTKFKLKVIRFERAIMISSEKIHARVKRFPVFKSGEEKLQRSLILSGTTAPPRSIPKANRPVKGNMTMSNSKKDIPSI